MGSGKEETSRAEWTRWNLKHEKCATERQLPFAAKQLIGVSELSQRQYNGLELAFESNMNIREASI